MDSNAKDKIFSQGIGEVSELSIGSLTIGDVTLEIDASDPDFLDKLQAAGKAMSNPNIPANLSEGDKTRALINTLDAYFDDLFGEGMAAKAFKTKSLVMRINAWGSIVEISNAQRASLEDKMASFNAKYSAGNRSQRRAAEKHKFHGKGKA